MKKVALLCCTLLLLILTSCIHEDDTPVKIPPSSGAVLEPNLGGPAEKNQVWVQLSTGKMTETPRENWDIGFYCGEDFKVILNYSLMMSAGKIAGISDIKSVTSASVKALQNLVQVANFDDNAQYIDHPSGDIKTKHTAIDAITLDDSGNSIYLVNLGYETYKKTPSAGTVYSIGDARGWKKIRVLRTADGYKIQYAGLDDTNIKEFTVAKNPDYNYRFFSFTTGNFADIEPKRKEWDICFTVFTNLTSFPGTNNYTSYIYADSVLHNILGNVGAYEVTTAAGQGEAAFNNFKKEDVDASKLIFNDRRAIGSNWRTTTGANGAEVFSNKFYILRDSDGFYYKIRFLRMKDDKGFRGYPQFEYKPL